MFIATHAEMWPTFVGISEIIQTIVTILPNAENQNKIGKNLKELDLSWIWARFELDS